MGSYRIQLVVGIVSSLLFVFPSTQGWGEDGHAIVCKIAQGRLNSRAAAAVKKLLPADAGNDLSSKCSWADHVRFIYTWSSPLHFADTPDALCTFNNQRDCVDQATGTRGRCVVAAIANYTTQLLDYGSVPKSKYNLTQALYFLSHFMGDIHQPLHCGFTTDRGGNDITVHWYTRKQNLHHIWDDSIIETEVERFYDSNITDFVNAIQQNIKNEWADQIEDWENCSATDIPCPTTYASESVDDACKWAYKDAEEGSVLEDDYFLSRYPIVNLRLAQAGVRLAATLNQILDQELVMSM
ncbi:endonuclease 2-like [Arachis stenosperma]|uniref:endonuclease 2-like n=1 Tax=Arachis stenosperma TaxID=217475 RepID=UPI0025AD3B87|nr:endonuclease 2-like [Arachis stenosperma]